MSTHRRKHQRQRRPQFVGGLLIAMSPKLDFIPRFLNDITACDWFESCVEHDIMI